MVTRTPETPTAGRDAGWTLGELTIVVVLILILAATAIPSLVGQRAKAVDAAIKSDLRSAGSAMAFSFADNPLAPADEYVNDNAEMVDRLGPYGYRPTDGNNVYMYYRGGIEYCLFGFNPSSNTYSSLATSLLYDSSAGGVITRAEVKPGSPCAA